MGSVFHRGMQVGRPATARRNECQTERLSPVRYRHRTECASCLQISSRDVRTPSNVRMSRRPRLRTLGKASVPDGSHGLDVPLLAGQRYPCFVGLHLSGFGRE